MTRSCTRRGCGRSSAQAAVKMAYGRDETDEFIQPTIVGEPAPIRDGDSVVTFNFRPDRMRQLVRALGEPDFAEFDRRGFPRIRLTTMTRYHEDWDYPVAFEEARPETTIAAVLAERGERQLHAAETEKYPHVTYFFNGGEEDPYPGEDRAWSPRRATSPTYDLKPEMSAAEAAGEFVRRWRAAAAEGAPYRFGIINFANPDMVGHTGSIPAATRAVETVDRCLGGGAGGGARHRRRGDRDGRPRQRRRDADARRQAPDGPLAEPRAAGRHDARRAAGRQAASWPTSRPRCWRCWASSSRRR